MKTEYLNNQFLESNIRVYQKSRQEKIRYELIIEDLRNSIAKRKKNKKEGPVSDLNHYMLEFQRVSREFENSQQELTKAFYTLTERLIRYARDIIVDSDDALQEGVFTCFEKLDKFTPEKGKAFNYMTTCVVNHFRQIYRSHKNFKQLKERYKIYLADTIGGVMMVNRKEIYRKDVNAD